MPLVGFEQVNLDVLPEDVVVRPAFKKIRNDRRPEKILTMELSCFAVVCLRFNVQRSLTQPQSRGWAEEISASDEVAEPTLLVASDAGSAVWLASAPQSLSMMASRTTVSLVLENSGVLVVAIHRPWRNA